MVLLLVLVVVTLLAALLSEFSFSSLVDLRLAETFRDSSRAYYLANGGVRAGRMLLQEDRNSYDGPDEVWSQGVVGYPVADGAVTISIADLGGRVDLNRLVTSGVNVDAFVKDRCLRLFTNLDLEDPAGLVDALIDWLDFGDSDQEQPLGAESAYYLGLPRPYPAGNGPLASFDELSLVKGFTAEVLATLAPHVTVYGGARININTASKEVILALSEQMDEQTAEEIVTSRAETPFKTLQQLQDLPGMETLYGAIATFIDLKSDNFRIESLGQVGDGARTVVAVVQKSGDRILYQRVY
ncbi:type II secretion system minor pseudopilin GspK [Desulfuromonas carbonis]